MRKGFLFLILACLICFSNVHTAYADTTYTISNDGKEKSSDDIYQDSGLPSSFVGAEYYDVAMPYNLSAFDVGGWVSDAYDDEEGDSAYVYSEEYLKSTKITANTCVEYSTFNSCKSVCEERGWGSIPLTEDEDTGCVVLEKNGVKFFIMAVQKFQFNTDTADSWFGGFKSESNGNLIDVILTDGTVIHFIKGDSNAAEHTNGSAGGNGAEKVHDFGEKNAHKWWTFEPVKLKQYANIYGVSACNSIEIWSYTYSSQKFKEYYNLGSGDDNNRIAYYRIYNVDITDDFTPAGDDVKGKDYKLNSVTFNADGTTTTNLGINLGQTGKYAESHFLNVTSLVEADLDLPNRDNLTREQLQGVVDWRKNIEYGKDDGLVKWLRIFVMLFGIVFLVWVLLIYLSYWFDRINNFIDIDLLPIVTAGRLRVAPEEHECTFNPKNFLRGQVQTVNHKVIIVICMIGIFFSVLTISGYMYTILNLLVRKALNLLT